MVRVLRASSEKPDAAIARLRAAATVESAEELAWELFDQWLAAGAPVKDKWALQALGRIGGDRCATRLAPLIRAWPGESQHKRAVLGLDVLRDIGNDVALMQLNGIAQKVKFKALQARAREAMEAVAAGLDMTGDELADRIVPDAGLDADGGRVFDYGPRQFTFALGPGLKPMVRDAAGKPRASPPKPTAADDAGRAAAALADLENRAADLENRAQDSCRRRQDPGPAS